MPGCADRPPGRGEWNAGARRPRWLRRPDVTGVPSGRGGSGRRSYRATSPGHGVTSSRGVVGGTVVLIARPPLPAAVTGKREGGDCPPALPVSALSVARVAPVLVFARLAKEAGAGSPAAIPYFRLCDGGIGALLPGVAGAAARSGNCPLSGRVLRGTRACRSWAVRLTAGVAAAAPQARRPSALRGCSAGVPVTSASRSAASSASIG